MTVAPAMPRDRIPAIRPIADLCLCPGCYWVATEQSELCLRCTVEGCDHEENRHYA